MLTCGNLMSKSPSITNQLLKTSICQFNKPYKNAVRMKSVHHSIKIRIVYISIYHNTMTT